MRNDGTLKDSRDWSSLRAQSSSLPETRHTLRNRVSSTETELGTRLTKPEDRVRVNPQDECHERQPVKQSMGHDKDCCESYCMCWTSEHHAGIQWPAYPSHLQSPLIKRAVARQLRLTIGAANFHEMMSDNALASHPKISPCHSLVTDRHSLV